MTLAHALDRVDLNILECLQQERPLLRQLR